MKAIPVLALVCVLMLSACPAFAIDAGTVTGTLQVNGKTIALTYAYAQMHDNAEGLLDFAKELRIVLADRAMPQESLRGIAFLPVTQLAREGKVQGILMRLDPVGRKSMYVTLLQELETPGMSLMTLTLADTERELIKNFKLGGNRVSGVVAHADRGASGSRDIPRISYTATFSAPLFHELPVTADLRGAAARKSPQVAVLKKKVVALRTGDFAAVGKLMSGKARQHADAFLEQAGPEAAKVSTEMIVDMEQSIAKIDRVVVRSSTAVALAGKDTWFTFVKEHGEWKSDD